MSFVKSIISFKISMPDNKVVDTYYKCIMYEPNIMSKVSSYLILKFNGLSIQKYLLLLY